jgi:hypothetical protein
MCVGAYLQSIVHCCDKVPLHRIYELSLEKLVWLKSLVALHHCPFIKRIVCDSSKNRESIRMIDFHALKILVAYPSYINK